VATTARAQRYYDICAGTGAKVGAAAVQFPLAHPAVTSVVCGLRSVAEVESASRRLHATVPAATWTALREAGLLASDAPTP
jgi:D-threo-aldose 1-dehydrogenase